MDIGQFLLPFWAYREAEKLIINTQSLNRHTARQRN